MTSSQASIRTAYDMASEAYARKFLGELDHKPFDRELLRHFASLVGAERAVLDTEYPSKRCYIFAYKPQRLE